ncbi:hypothetical protein SLEP1_g15140 [Rubroshorea leprosula]|uniref:Secreted protein n=1 Tax=Rubroshorea leprosula TaxID=152421 RepID=A0AAV5IVB0_9ROSI|nr:hypothetical protein SLEP1_g15140 [Rubroshorea leprosula]
MLNLLFLEFWVARELALHCRRLLLPCGGELAWFLPVGFSPNSRRQLSQSAAPVLLENYGSKTENGETTGSDELKGSLF